MSKFRYVVELIEHERGYGQRHVCYKLFKTHDEMDKYLIQLDKERLLEYNQNPSYVPDTYINAVSRGIREIDKKGNPVFR